jgi:hypothetical protein
MASRDRVAGVALVLAALYVLWENRVLPLGTYDNPGAGYMPMVLAVLLAAMGSLVVLTGGRSPRLAAVAWTEWRHAVAILGACAFAALALERLGYRLTVMLLVMFLLVVMEHKRPVAVGLIALGLALGTFYVFYDLLKVPLPLGPWEF